ncbi:hypothetical protein ACQ4PT_001701 [Festuca glaucescens]
MRFGLTSSSYLCNWHTLNCLAEQFTGPRQCRWKALDFASLKHGSISFFNVEKPETAASRWARARTRAAKVGKGLSKNGKAQKLALQHCLEAQERQQYEVVVESGKVVFKETGVLVHSSDDSKWIFVLSTTKAFYVGQAIWPYSGHYLPTEENFRDFVRYLQENDVDLTDVKNAYVATIRPIEHMAASNGSTLPTVDLAPFFVDDDEDGVARARATELVREACQSSGFFRVVNHGVPRELMARALELQALFFALPDEEKAKVRPTEGTTSPPFPAGHARQPTHSVDKNELLLVLHPELWLNLHGPRTHGRRRPPSRSPRSPAAGPAHHLGARAAGHPGGVPPACCLG